MPNKSDLFKGLTDVEIEKFLQDSLSTTIELDKDMEVFYQGNKPEYLLMPLSNNDVNGNLDFSRTDLDFSATRVNLNPAKSVPSFS